MHLGYFFIEIISFILQILSDLCDFAKEFIFPTVKYIVPIIIDYACIILSVIVKLVFTYVSPCFIFLLDVITMVISCAIRVFGNVCVFLIEFDCVLFDRRIIVIGALVIGLIYYQQSKRIAEFMCETWRLISLNAAFLIKFVKIVAHFLNYGYQRVRRIVSKNTTVTEGEEHKNKWLDNFARGISGHSFICNDFANFCDGYVQFVRDDRLLFGCSWKKLSFMQFFGY